MEVRVNKESDYPVEIKYGDSVISMSLDETEELNGMLKDAISELCLEQENDVIRNVAKYLHEEGVRASKVEEMAGEIQKIIMKYSPKFNIEEYYQERRKREV